LPISGLLSEEEASFLVFQIRRLSPTSPNERSLVEEANDSHGFEQRTDDGSIDMCVDVLASSRGEANKIKTALKQPFKEPLARVTELTARKQNRKESI
jgi:hypothetical protein